NLCSIGDDACPDEWVVASGEHLSRGINCVLPLAQTVSRGVYQPVNSLVGRPHRLSVQGGQDLAANDAVRVAALDVGFPGGFALSAKERNRIPLTWVCITMKLPGLP